MKAETAGRLWASRSLARSVPAIVSSPVIVTVFVARRYPRRSGRVNGCGTRASP
jgi:hypothetical protein